MGPRTNLIKAGINYYLNSWDVGSASTILDLFSEVFQPESTSWDHGLATNLLDLFGFAYKLDQSCNQLVSGQLGCWFSVDYTGSLLRYASYE